MSVALARVTAFAGVVASLTFAQVGCADRPDAGREGDTRRADRSAGSDPIAAAAEALPAESLPDRFGFGRPATQIDIAPLDIDVGPDGTGLPPGRGTVAEGARLFGARCAACHGRTGTEGPADVLVGREPGEFLFGRYTSLTKTIGNYWPYPTTLYDYIHRAMPLDRPGSLAPDEVYGLVAWLLWRNEIVPDDAVMDARTLPAVRMPTRDRFVPDDRKGGPEVR